MFGRGDKGGELFSLDKSERMYVGIGADTGARAMPTDLIVGRVLTDEDIGTGVQVPEPVYATSDAFTPYGAAWKEYDSLQKAAKGGGLFGFLAQHWWYGGISGIASMFDPHKHARPLERILFLAAVAVIVMHAARARWAASQLEHWLCPRCHSEWPGKKLDKEPRCAVCGLKLHQLTA
jgi:hypothetical protein